MCDRSIGRSTVHRSPIERQRDVQHLQIANWRSHTNEIQLANFSSNGIDLRRRAHNLIEFETIKLRILLHVHWTGSLLLYWMRHHKSSVCPFSIWLAAHPMNEISIYHHLQLQLQLQVHPLRLHDVSPSYLIPFLLALLYLVGNGACVCTARVSSWEFAIVKWWCMFQWIYLKQ